MAKYDKRTVDRYVEKGLFKRADVDSYLKALPDDEGHGSWVEMDVDAEEVSDSMDEGTSDGAAE